MSPELCLSQLLLLFGLSSGCLLFDSNLLLSVELLKFLHALCLFLVFFLLYESAAFGSRVRAPISIFDEPGALVTLLGLVCAHLNVGLQLLIPQNLAAVLTRLRPHLAACLMLVESVLVCLPAAVLAFDLDVGFGLVLLPL